MSVNLKYKPGGDTLKRFMLDNSFFRGIRGPVGSGKSACCAIELFRRALSQEKGPDGKRRTRWAIIRNTYGELRTTTIKTWMDWFPEENWGAIKWAPPPYVHHIQKGDIDCEIIFIALDRAEHVKKLLSLELTGGWINEAREIPKSILDALTFRVGRFPSMRDGGPTWHGIIADTNAPDDDHWWPIVAGEVPIPDHMSRDEALMLIKPSNWEFYTQPGAMSEIRDKAGNVTGYEPNPKAENVQNLTPTYYPQSIQGKTKSWIDVYVLNKLGTIAEGRVVYPGFTPELHLSREKLQATPGVPIIVGMDFGLTPAAIFCQFVRGRWTILRELVAQDMGIVRFAEEFKREVSVAFPDHDVIVFGDPSGDYRAQTDERTPFQILRASGVVARPAPSNDVALRIEAVANPISRLVDGKPGFVVDPSCVNLLKGFTGGYCYRRLQVSGSERYDDRPDKNRFSHIHDALQYALSGGGEARRLTGSGQQKSVQARVPMDVFSRQPVEHKSRVKFRL
jgi:hypothetical protein